MSPPSGKPLGSVDLARLIDQTFLRPARTSEITRSYVEAVKAGCGCFVTHAAYLPALGKLGLTKKTALAAVIDFPFGLASTGVKVSRIHQAASWGATELELVINMRQAADGDYRAIGRELRALEKASRGLVRKVIIETAYRDRESMLLLAGLVAREGFEFVKTSTGYAPAGATVADVRLLAGTLGSSCGLKASGGIRDLGRCLSMLAAGAGRIGTSRGKEIVMEAASLKRGDPRYLAMQKLFGRREGEVSAPDG